MSLLAKIVKRRLNGVLPDDFTGLIGAVVASVLANLYVQNEKFQNWKDWFLQKNRTRPDVQAELNKWFALIHEMNWKGCMRPLSTFKPSVK